MTSKQLTLPVTIARAGFVWGEQNKYPYVQFSEFCNYWLSLICLNEDPHMDQLFTELLKRGEELHGESSMKLLPKVRRTIIIEYFKHRN